MSWEEVWSFFCGGRAPKDGRRERHTTVVSKRRRAMSWSACLVFSSWFLVRSLSSPNKLQNSENSCPQSQSVAECRNIGGSWAPQPIVQSQEHPFRAHHLITYKGEFNLIYCLRLKQKHWNLHHQWKSFLLKQTDLERIKHEICLVSCLGYTPKFDDHAQMTKIMKVID